MSKLEIKGISQANGKEAPFDNLPKLGPSQYICRTYYFIAILYSDFTNRSEEQDKVHVIRQQCFKKRVCDTGGDGLFI